MPATQESQYHGFEFDPAIHADGTVFTIEFAGSNQAVGYADPAPGTFVVGIDPTTGTSKFRVPLHNSSTTLTNAAGDFCQRPPGTSIDEWGEYPYTGLAIAGDGKAYLLYQT